VHLEAKERGEYDRNTVLWTVESFSRMALADRAEIYCATSMAIVLKAFFTFQTNENGILGLSIVFVYLIISVCD
jgi:hypothetical protein